MTTCRYCGIEDEKQGWRIVIAFFVLAYVAPLTVIASTYFTLLHHLRSHDRHSSISVGDARPTSSLRAAAAAAASSAQSLSSRRASTVVSRRASHVTRVLVVVVVVFAVCWLPLHIHLLIAYCGVQPARRWYEIYRVLAHCLAYANCCMNPVIYSYVSSDFKRRFVDVMFASRSCRRCHVTTDTADGGRERPEVQLMRMRSASYESVVLDPLEPGVELQLHSNDHA